MVQIRNAKQRGSLGPELKTPVVRVGGDFSVHNYS